MTSETLMKGIFSKYCHFGCYSRYILYKLVSQATVFVTSHNTTPHEREGKGEEGGALCDETKTGRWETTYKLDLGNITLDPGKATTTQLHGLSGRQSKL